MFIYIYYYSTGVSIPVKMSRRRVLGLSTLKPEVIYFQSYNIRLNVIDSPFAAY